LPRDWQERLAAIAEGDMDVALYPDDARAVITELARQADEIERLRELEKAVLTGEHWRSEFHTGAEWVRLPQ
jgi:hypothetical protein